MLFYPFLLILNRVRHLNSSSPVNWTRAPGNPESSRMSADDRLSPGPLGSIEGGNRIVKGSHFTDVCPQPTNPEPLNEHTQLGAIGFDDKIDRPSARGPRIDRAGDGHQRSSSSNQVGRPLRNVAAEDIENQIDF